MSRRLPSGAGGTCLSMPPLSSYLGGGSEGIRVEYEQAGRGGRDLRDVCHPCPCSLGCRTDEVILPHDWLSSLQGMSQRMSRQSKVYRTVAGCMGKGWVCMACGKKSRKVTPPLHGRQRQSRQDGVSDNNLRKVPSTAQGTHMSVITLRVMPAALAMALPSTLPTTVSSMALEHRHPAMGPPWKPAKS